MRFRRLTMSATLRDCDEWACTLFSLHIPKTAGDSLLNLLHRKFGEALFLRGYPATASRARGFAQAVAGSLANMEQKIGLDLGLPVRTNTHPKMTGTQYQVEPAQERELIKLSAEDYRLWCWEHDREGV